MGDRRDRLLIVVAPSPGEQLPIRDFEVELLADLAMDLLKEGESERVDDE